MQKNGIIVETTWNLAKLALVNGIKGIVVLKGNTI